MNDLSAASLVVSTAQRGLGRLGKIVAKTEESLIHVKVRRDHC